MYHQGGNVPDADTFLNNHNFVDFLIGPCIPVIEPTSIHQKYENLILALPLLCNDVIPLSIFSLYTIFAARAPDDGSGNHGHGRSASTQAGLQAAALFITLGIAIVTGTITGSYKSPNKSINQSEIPKLKVHYRICRKERRARNCGRNLGMI